MRYLLCNEVVRELDFAAQCELAAELGYAGLEVAPFTLAADPLALTEQERRALRRSAEEAGIVIGGLHWLLVTPEGLSITSSDEEIWQKTVQVMEGLVQLCGDLGGSVLVHGSPAQRQLPGNDPHSARERAQEAFRRAATAAEEAGVTYCIEPLSPQETTFINTVGEAARIVNEVGSPSLKTMIDLRAARLGEAEPPEEVLDRWLPGGLIAHVHLNDRNKRAPGQGSDPFAPVLAKLREYDYPGYCGVEPFIYEPDGPLTAARAIGYLQGAEEGLA